MPRFGWARLAYLLLVLTVLAVLARPGGPGSETRLAAELPRGPTATGGAPSDAAVPSQPEMSRRIEDSISSLVDLSGDGGPPQTQNPRVTARPPAPVAPAPGAPAGESAPPVFYRPPPAGGPGDVTAAGPVCGDLGRFPESSRVVFPLDDRYFYSYEDTWGAPRVQGGHEGTDLMAPKGTPEYAATDGTVVPVAGSNENGWNSLGGYAVMVRADYSIGPVREGDLFYYAHLDRRSPLEIGTRVRAGQILGYAGDTGQGPEITRGLFPAHLHFGWYDATGTRSAVASGAMNPYPLLEWIKANGGAVIGGSNARYCEAPSPPAPAPSTGQNAWPGPDAPGVRPDLDTGSNDPKPTQAVQNEEFLRPVPPERPAPDRRQDRDPLKSPQKDPRHAAGQAPDFERSGSPDPPIPEPPAPDPTPPDPPDLSLPESEPPASKPQEPGLPRPKPFQSEAPKPPAPEGATPSQEPPPGEAGEGEPEVPPTRPDLPESRPPDLDREDEPGRTDGEREDEEREEEQAEDPARQDREERPDDTGPEGSREPQVDQAPPEQQATPEEQTPPPETADPDAADEPESETTEPETTEPEEDEPLPETTVVPEATTG